MFNYPSTTEIYTYLHTLSLHYALPISSTAAKVPSGTSSWLARSGCDRRACSVKVPSGPRKPTRRSGPGAASSVTRRNATGVDEAAILQLLADVRSGELHPDDAVVELRRLPFAHLGLARVAHHRPLPQGMAGDRKRTVEGKRGAA